MYENYEKMLFPLNPSDWHGVTGERIWVEPVGESDTKVFRLLNSPFYAHGVSYLDLVWGVPEEDGEGLQYGGTIEKSGHSNIWLLVPPESAFAEHWSILQELGCTYEGSNEGKIGTLYSVDVPPETDIDRVLSIIGKAQAGDVWRFQIGHLAHERAAPQPPN